MNPSLSLSLTPKGVEEVKTRTYKLNMKKRSVLLLLERAQTVQYVLDKAIFSSRELLEEIALLAQDGFLHVGDGSAAAPSLTPAAAVAGPPSISPGSASGPIYIHKDVMLSEARFILVNFCVDTFGTHADQYIDALKQCKSVDQLTACVKQIDEITRSNFPQHAAALKDALKEVNQTAL